MMRKDVVTTGRSTAEPRDLGVSLRCAPGRAARAVGNDTTVANRAGPPPRPPSARSRRPGARAAASRPSGRASLTHLSLGHHLPGG